MNYLLTIFCYIISNVSIRKNLHSVQLMIESYPDREVYFEKQCLLRIQGAWHALPDQSGAIKSRFQESLKSQDSKAYIPSGFQIISQLIWGNQVKIPRISQECQKQ